MSHEKCRKLEEACAELGLEKPVVIEFVRREWVLLKRPAENLLDLEMEQEDIARVHLILELQRDFGVNDEGVSLILHLLDQLYALRKEIEKKTA